MEEESKGSREEGMLEVERLQPTVEWVEADGEDGVAEGGKSGATATVRWVRMDPGGNRRALLGGSGAGTVSPGPRVGHSLTQTASGSAYLFGGLDDGLPPRALQDVFELRRDGGSGWEGLSVGSEGGGGAGAVLWVRVSVSGDAPSGRWAHSATLLGDGASVLVFGGFATPTRWLSDTWVLDTGEMQWWAPPRTVSGSFPAPRGGHSCCMVASGLAVVFGGVGGGGISRKYLNDVWVLDPESWEWAEVQPAGRGPEPRAFHSAVAQGETMLVLGGVGEFAGFPLDVLHILDLSDESAAQWTALRLGGSVPVGLRWEFGACLIPALPSDLLVVVGGSVVDATTTGADGGGGAADASDSDTVAALALSQRRWLSVRASALLPASVHPTSSSSSSSSSATPYHPGPRASPAVAFDPKSQRVLLHGGRGGRTRGGLFALQLAPLVGPPYAIDAANPRAAVDAGSISLRLAERGVASAAGALRAAVDGGGGGGVGGGGMGGGGEKEAMAVLLSQSDGDGGHTITVRFEAAVGGKTLVAERPGRITFSTSAETVVCPVPRLFSSPRHDSLLDDVVRAAQMEAVFRHVAQPHLLAASSLEFLLRSSTSDAIPPPASSSSASSPSPSPSPLASRGSKRRVAFFPEPESENAPFGGAEDAEQRALVSPGAVDMKVRLQVGHHPFTSTAAKFCVTPITDPKRCVVMGAAITGGALPPPLHPPHLPTSSRSPSPAPPSSPSTTSPSSPAPPTSRPRSLSRASLGLAPPPSAAGSSEAFGPVFGLVVACDALGHPRTLGGDRVAVFVNGPMPEPPPASPHHSHPLQEELFSADADPLAEGHESALLESEEGEEEEEEEEGGGGGQGEDGGASGRRRRMERKKAQGEEGDGSMFAFAPTGHGGYALPLGAAAGPPVATGSKDLGDGSHLIWYHPTAPGSYVVRVEILVDGASAERDSLAELAHSTPIAGTPILVRFASPSQPLSASTDASTITDPKTKPKPRTKTTKSKATSHDPPLLRNILTPAAIRQSVMDATALDRFASEVLAAIREAPEEGGDVARLHATQEGLMRMKARRAQFESLLARCAVTSWIADRFGAPAEHHFRDSSASTSSSSRRARHSSSRRTRGSTSASSNDSSSSSSSSSSSTEAATANPYAEAVRVLVPAKSACATFVEALRSAPVAKETVAQKLRRGAGATRRELRDFAARAAAFADQVQDLSAWRFEVGPETARSALDAAARDFSALWRDCQAARRTAFLHGMPHAAVEATRTTRHVAKQLLALGALWDAVEDAIALSMYVDSLPWHGSDLDAAHERARKQTRDAAASVPRAVRSSDAFVGLMDLLRSLARAFPVLSSLRHPSVKRRHWRALLQRLHKADPEAAAKLLPLPCDDPEKRLGALISAGLVRISADVAEITDRANKEAQVERHLARFRKQYLPHEGKETAEEERRVEMSRRKGLRAVERAGREAEEAEAEERALRAARHGVPSIKGFQRPSSRTMGRSRRGSSRRNSRRPSSRPSPRRSISGRRSSLPDGLGSPSTSPRSPSPSPSVFPSPPASHMKTPSPRRSRRGSMDMGSIRRRNQRRRKSGTGKKDDGRDGTMSSSSPSSSSAVLSASEVAAAVEEVESDDDDSVALIDDVQALPDEPSRGMQLSVIPDTTATASTKRPPPRVGLAPPDAELLQSDLILARTLAGGAELPQAFARRLDSWLQRLQLASRTMEEAVEVHRHWRRLAPLYAGSEEVREKLPDDTRAFERADATMRSHLKAMASKQNLLEATENSKVYDSLKSARNMLEKCRRALGTFLEVKRASFPRLYFLSEAELIEFLATRTDAQAAAAFAPKILPATRSLQGIEDGGDGSEDGSGDGEGEGDAGRSEKRKGVVCAWTASQGSEVVPLEEDVSVVDQSPEEWMARVLEGQRDTLRRAVARAATTYESISRTRWFLSSRKPSPPTKKGIRKGGGAEAGGKKSGRAADVASAAGDMAFPAQAALLVVRVVQCRDIEAALREENPAEALDSVAKRRREELADAIDAVRKPHLSFARSRLMNLITTDAHARDTLAKLRDTEAVSSTSYEWISQLRPSLTTRKKGRSGSVAACKVSILWSVFPYGWDYVGDGQRLVVTPLTDRIYLTAALALANGLGGAPAGPAGTGKTETVKDLASLLGRHALVYNCGPELTAHDTASIFRGLAAAGAWGCFDEFNRLRPETLSIVALQVRALVDGVRAQQETVTLEGTTSALHAKALGLFVTMNPGYLGRSELPEDLKSLFRPVQVLRPDAALICENILMAQGFAAAPILARKLNGLYRFLADLLPERPQHDWGLRAMKSVLIAAAERRTLLMSSISSSKEPGEEEGEEEEEKTPIISSDDGGGGGGGDDDDGKESADVEVEVEEIETEAMVTAVVDVTIPRLPQGDQSAFNRAMSDLFPGSKKIRKDADARRFDAKRALAAAASRIGLFATTTLVHKASELSALLQTRHSAFLLGPPGSGKTSVRQAEAEATNTMVISINPKALRLGDLYGFMDRSTHEWVDGVFGGIFRTLARVHPRPAWLVLDGDLDSGWCESLNSVMDDNRLLTLPSGERVALESNARLVFELNNLQYASPATVSRAAILLLPPDARSAWEGAIRAWLLNSGFSKRLQSRLQTTVVAAARAYDKARRSGDLQIDLPIPTTGVISSFLAMITSLIPSLDTARAIVDDGDHTTTTSAAASAVVASAGSGESGGESGSGSAAKPSSSGQQQVDTYGDEVGEDDGEAMPNLRLCKLVVDCADGSSAVPPRGAENSVADAFWKPLDHAVAFAAVWAFCSGLEDMNETQRAMRSDWLRTTLRGGEGLTAGDVFSTYLHPGTGSFKPWLPQVSSGGSGAMISPTSTSIVVDPSVAIDGPFLRIPTEASTMLSYWARRLLPGGHSIAAVGPAGWGKSTAIAMAVEAFVRESVHHPDHFMPELPTGVATSISLPLTYSTNPSSLQAAIEAKLEACSQGEKEKRGEGVDGCDDGGGVPRMGVVDASMMVLLVDDLSVAREDEFGTQSPLAFLRQLVDGKSWSQRPRPGEDLADNPTQFIDGVTVAATIDPHSGIRCNPRLLRHFASFPVGPGTDAAITTLAQGLWTGIVLRDRNFDSETAATGAKFARGTLAMLRQCGQLFRPAANTPHYHFALSQLVGVFRGLSLASPQRFRSQAKMVKYWAHEVQRQLGDRLSSPQDVIHFHRLLSNEARKLFPDVPLNTYLDAEEEEGLPRDPLVFGTFVNAARGDSELEQAPSMQKVLTALESACEDHDATSSNPLSLVLFHAAVLHTARIARALSVPGTSIVLVGARGSGKQSLARLAAHACDVHPISLSLASSSSSSAGTSETSGQGSGSGGGGMLTPVPEVIAAELRTASRLAGVRDRPVCVMMRLADVSGSVDPAAWAVLETVVGLSTRGHAHGLWSVEERDKVLSEKLSLARTKGLTLSREKGWEVLQNSIRSNLHLVLTCPADAEVLRQLSRRIPHLTCSATLDWMLPWPDSAFRAIAMRVLAPVSQLGGARAALRGAAAEFSLASVRAAERVATRAGLALPGPRGFLAMLQSVRTIADTVGAMMEGDLDRLITGLRRLASARLEAGMLATELGSLLERAQEKAEEAQRLIDEVGSERERLAEEAAAASVEREACDKIRLEVSAAREETERDLRAAEPMLREAEAALQSVSRAELSETRTMQQPPRGVDDVFVSLLLLLAQIHPRVSVSRSGKVPPKDRTWAAVRATLLLDVHALMDLLSSFKVEWVDTLKVPARNWEEVRRYTVLEHFRPEEITKRNRAAAGLCQWVRSLVEYQRVLEVVQPKRDALEEATHRLEDATTRLKAAEDRVEGLREALRAKEMEAEAAEADAQAAKDEVKLMQRRLDLAQRLTRALGTERERWGRSAKSLARRLRALPGDALLAACFLSYAGAYSRRDRAHFIHELITPSLIRALDSIPSEQVVEYCAEVDARAEAGEDAAAAAAADDDDDDDDAVSVATGASHHLGDLEESTRGSHVLLSSDADPLTAFVTEELRSLWQSWGLPAERSSLESAVVSMYAERWPLLLDPFDSGQSWLRQAMESSNLIILPLTAPGCLGIVAWAMSQGRPVLLTDVSASPTVLNTLNSLAPILRKHGFRYNSSPGAPPPPPPPTPTSSSSSSSSSSSFSSGGEETERKDSSPSSSRLPPPPPPPTHTYASKREESVTRDFGYVELDVSVQEADAASHLLASLFGRRGRSEDEEEGDDVEEWKVPSGKVKLFWKPSFRLWLHTSVSSTSDLPASLTADLTVVSFALAPEALQAALRDEIVKREHRILAMKRLQLVREEARDRAELRSLEDRILDHLARAGETGLTEDETLVKELEGAKELAEAARVRLRGARAAAAELRKTASRYDSTAQRGAILWNALERLPNVHLLYETSFASFWERFFQGIETARQRKLDRTSRGQGTGKRRHIRALTNRSTLSVLGPILRGMRSQEQLALALTIASQVAITDGTLDEAAARVLFHESLTVKTVIRALGDRAPIVREAMSLSSSSSSFSSSTSSSSSSSYSSSSSSSESATSSSHPAPPGVAVVSLTPPGRAAEWLGEKTWEKVRALEVLGDVAVPALRGLGANMNMFSEAWRDWYDEARPELLPTPLSGAARAGEVGPWVHILLVKALRPDRLLASVIDPVHESLGRLVARCFHKMGTATGLGVALRHSIDDANPAASTAETRRGRRKKGGVRGEGGGGEGEGEFGVESVESESDGSSSESSDDEPEEEGEEEGEDGESGDGRKVEESGEEEKSDGRGIPAPILVVLHPGQDLVGTLQSLAKTAKVPFQAVSLGEGQAERAESLLRESVESGSWIALLNAHQDANTAGRLGEVLMSMRDRRLSPKFRVFFAVEAPPLPLMRILPASLVRNALKVMIEPPLRLADGASWAWQEMRSSGKVRQVAKGNRWRLASLALLHGILAARRRFHRFGWAKPYAFGPGDLDAASTVVCSLSGKKSEGDGGFESSSSDQEEAVVLQRLIGSVVYGGHVANAWDRRVLDTYSHILIRKSHPMEGQPWIALEQGEPTGGDRGESERKSPPRTPTHEHHLSRHSPQQQRESRGSPTSTSSSLSSPTAGGSRRRSRARSRSQSPSLETSDDGVEEEIDALNHGTFVLPDPDGEGVTPSRIFNFLAHHLPPEAPIHYGLHPIAEVGTLAADAYAALRMALVLGGRRSGGREGGSGEDGGYGDDEDEGDVRDGGGKHGGSLSGANRREMRHVVRRILSTLPRSIDPAPLRKRMAPYLRGSGTVGDDGGDGEEEERGVDGEVGEEKDGKRTFATPTKPLHKKQRRPSRPSDDRSVDLARKVVEALAAPGSAEGKQTQRQRDGISGKAPPFLIILMQEAERLARLLGMMRRTLSALGRALEGKEPFTPSLEALGEVLIQGQVPGRNPLDKCPSWDALGWQSSASLAPWLSSLSQRAAQLHEWARSLQLPQPLWLAGLWRPAPFLAATRQAVSAQLEIPFDQTVIHTHVTTYRTHRDLPLWSSSGGLPTRGVLVSGLSLSLACHVADAEDGGNPLDPYVLDGTHAPLEAEVPDDGVLCSGWIAPPRRERQSSTTGSPLPFLYLRVIRSDQDAIEGDEHLALSQPTPEAISLAKHFHSKSPDGFGPEQPTTRELKHHSRHYGDGDDDDELDALEEEEEEGEEEEDEEEGVGGKGKKKDLTPTSSVLRGFSRPGAEPCIVTAPVFATDERQGEPMFAIKLRSDCSSDAWILGGLAAFLDHSSSPQSPQLAS